MQPSRRKEVEGLREKGEEDAEVKVGGGGRAEVRRVDAVARIGPSTKRVRSDPCANIKGDDENLFGSCHGKLKSGVNGRQMRHIVREDYLHIPFNYTI